LLLLGAGARGLMRAARTVAADESTDQALCAACIVAVAGVVVDSLFSGVLVMPQSQMSVALVLGIAIGWTRSRQPATTAGASIGTRIAGSVLVLAAVAVLALATGPDAVRKWEGGPLTAQEQAHNRGVQWPRLWQAGYF
jgi:hypothetical protein